MFMPHTNGSASERQSPGNFHALATDCGFSKEPRAGSDVYSFDAWHASLEWFVLRGVFAMKMLRKALLLGIVLLLTGIFPVLAHGGSCHQMPCCHPKGPIITQSDASCCSPATCVRETAGVNNSELAKQHQKQFAVLQAVVIDRIAVTQAAGASVIVPSGTPPRTGERLAILSTLLI